MKHSGIRKIIRNILNENFKKKYSNSVYYSAVMFEDAAEIQKIADLAKQYVPAQGWIISDNYHMTIAQGVLPDSLRMRGDLNSEVEITINMIGISDKAIAFGVHGYYSKNEMPHITLAFKSGASPVDSNQIESWKPIDKVLVKGVVREVGIGNKILKEMPGINNSPETYPNNPGPPSEFPKENDFDQFGNLLNKTK